MQIKPNYLEQHLQKTILPVYWLAGQDIYLIEESLGLIKKYLRQQHHEYDEKIIYVTQADEWQHVIEEANSYSLFSESTVLHVIYEKKTLDATGKKALTHYLKNYNTSCTLIIRTPNCSAKHLNWLTALNELLFVMHYPLTHDVLIGWIKTALKKKSLRVTPGVPEFIQQHTQGNMLACAQVIEKLSLHYLEQELTITIEQVKEHVHNQCEHTLFELTDACLLGEADKAIQIVRHAAQNKTEATLVLWIFTQEARQLIQLDHHIKTSNDFKTTCKILNIWPQRISMYQKALRRLNQTQLNSILHQCAYIDECIKSNTTTQIWNYLERVVLYFAQAHVCFSEQHRKI